LRKGKEEDTSLLDNVTKRGVALMRRNNQNYARKRFQVTTHKKALKIKARTSSVFGGELKELFSRYGHNSVAVEETTLPNPDSMCQVRDS
jgi:hypothetical protein